MEKLRRYDMMRQAMRNIPAEIERLREEATLLKSPSTDGIYVRGSGGRQEDARINNIVQRQELERNLLRVRQWLDVTERGLFALDEDERTILQHLYLYPQKGAIHWLCNELGLEQSSVYRKRDQALLHFTAAIYGFSET